MLFYDYELSISLIFFNELVNILISEYVKQLDTPMQLINKLQESFYVDALKDFHIISKLMNDYLSIREEDIYDV